MSDREDAFEVTEAVHHELKVTPIAPGRPTRVEVGEGQSATGRYRVYHARVACHTALSVEDEPVAPPEPVHAHSLAADSQLDLLRRALKAQLTSTADRERAVEDAEFRQHLVSRSVARDNVRAVKDGSDVVGVDASQFEDAEW